MVVCCCVVQSQNNLRRYLCHTCVRFPLAVRTPNPMAAPAPAGKAFGDLPQLSPPTLGVLRALGLTRCTPVQQAVIPLFCGNKDVSVDACTGSGKTLAFVLPIIERLRKLEEPIMKHQVGRMGPGAAHARAARAAACPRRPRLPRACAHRRSAPSSWPPRASSPARSTPWPRRLWTACRA